MTAPTAQRELHDPINGRVPDLDSPAVRARARASMPVTGRDRNEKADRSTRKGWSAWTAVPDSLQQAWVQSSLDPKRIPAGNGGLKVLWLVSNWTDRLLWFAVALIAPAGLTGAVRWAAQRPTRRWATLIVLAALTGAVIIGKVL